MTGRLPSFLIKRTPKQENIRQIRSLLNDPGICTVCEEAKCPNIGECFSRKTCTFMILGDTCTRSCAFCGAKHGIPQPPNHHEPEAIAQAVQKLGLNYVVITSVTRDDLPDGGAEQFRNVETALVAVQNSRTGTSPVPTLKIEFLIPDFQGDKRALITVLSAKPYVLNHNVETVPRLYPKVRPQANYQRSLELLKRVKEFAGRRIYTKSGFMVGLGETKEEVFSVLNDLNSAGCDIVTIGQYLPPSKAHLKPERYVAPEEFAEYKTFGQMKVFAGPFVRSSYQAGEIINEIHPG